MPPNSLLAALTANIYFSVASGPYASGFIPTEFPQAPNLVCRHALAVDPFVFGVMLRSKIVGINGVRLD
ncbi:MAG: hypothetical protein WAN46_18040 [Gammaproteobacteria bacterium]